MEQIRTETRFFTKDLGEAACLYATEETRFIGLEPAAGHYLFVFKNKKACDKVISDYWRGNCSVDAKSMVNALRSLKDMIFSKKL